MSQHSGFFTSSGGDRKYTSDWLARYIQSIISNGVYTTELTVSAGIGMVVQVGTGRAWINGYMYENDSALMLPIDTADGSLGRIDNIVVRLSLTNCEIALAVVKGEYSSSPIAPAPTRTANVYELVLARVLVAAGTTAITGTMITDMRADESVCGIVAGAVTQLNTAELLGRLTAGFNEWFAGIKGQLSEDAAGHLLNLISGLHYTFNFTASDWQDSGEDKIITIPFAQHGMSSNGVTVSLRALKNGKYIAKTWADQEVYAEVDDNHDITLVMPGSAGSTLFAGRAELYG